MQTCCLLLEDELYGCNNVDKALKWSLSILTDLDTVKQDCFDIDLKECKAYYLFCVAEMYDIGGYKDDLKAINYYKESALLSGDVYVVHIVGDFYLFRKKDAAEALKWFKQFKCYHTLGLYYRQGKGFKQDYSKALRYFKLSISVRCGTYYNYSDEAMYEIGNLYYNGWGVPKDYEEAIKWYQLAGKSLARPEPDKSSQEDCLQDIELGLPFQAGDDSVPF